ncbi:anhydro-N-acetylmuramic acid kinase [Pararhodonellum marinum]|uniref:anhydro-N-acetylmuramic acid kinase n=1 Tax=Pararhodonellum marinum TaxID=2755358 RepID=UPI00188EFFAD|nr:anhydro-N-acetylmuramic acid kinase [Pararhodonellum marinum]
MSRNSYQMLGLMSGTSGDGLDMACCEFNFGSHWSHRLIKSKTSLFPEKLGEKLNQAHVLNGADLAILDRDFGKWMGEQVHYFCTSESLNPLAIASHGHTVFHQPQNRTSLQIGNGWDMLIASGIPVINDFRNLDIALGGQGAPLVPVGDRLLFADMDFCLNLGGICNISMEVSGERKAFDICPFNLLLNRVIQKIGLPFDDGGKLARSGKLIPEFLKALDSVPFYTQKGAKSLGREDLEKDFFPLLNNLNDPEEDILFTIVNHYAGQISNVILSHLNGSESKKLLATGGGAYHRFFMESLAQNLKGKVTIVDASPELIEFKEAIVFAFLGVLRLRGENNCLASVTGAKRDSCGGTMYGLGENMTLEVSHSGPIKSH